MNNDDADRCAAKRGPIAALCAITLAMVAQGSGAYPASVVSPVPKDGRIGYVAVDLRWSVYQTKDGKTECPEGFNEYGPREVFAELYPNGGTVIETRLYRESLKFFPEDSNEQFPFPLATGDTAIGLNLDGKGGPRDFKSPSGRNGIDNELYRVIGCIRNYRTPDGQLQLFSARNVRKHIYNRTLIELTDVQSLENDDQVRVNMYRGLDRLLTDASGDNIQPGGTQRVDERFGKRFMHQLKGKIVDGVLTTEPQDVIFPWTIMSSTPGEIMMRDMRLRLNLTEKTADGLMGGYADIESYYNNLTDWTTHHLSYGQTDPSAVYRHLRHHADAYPDQNGNMTAISSSIGMKMVQVFIVHNHLNEAVSKPEGRN